MESLVLNAIWVVVVFIVLALFSDQVKASAPLIARRIVRIACYFLPAHLRERYEEEWLSNIDELPGGLWKLVTAFGCSIAVVPIARRSSILHESQEKRLVAEPGEFRIQVDSWDPPISPEEIARGRVWILYLTVFVGSAALIAYFATAILSEQNPVGPVQFGSEIGTSADQDLQIVERHKVRFTPWNEPSRFNLRPR